MQLLKLFRLPGLNKKHYPMILVTGNPKTGTTAVYYSIKNALPLNTVCLFEPEHRKLRLPKEIKTPLLVKSFVPASEVYDHFDRKILIVRDPRDRIISQMLYRPYNIISQEKITAEVCDQMLQEMIRLLHRKELDPGSVSAREIRELLDIEPINDHLDKLIDYHQNRPDVFVYKYEDYIDGHLEKLNKYLGLKVDKVGNVPEKRVIRSKSYGNWKDWFTPSDVEFFRPMVKDYMQMFGYRDDWELNSKPVIDPAINSNYVINLIEEAKEMLARKKAKESESLNRNPD
jgi:hypothetical protein